MTTFTVGDEEEEEKENFVNFIEQHLDETAPEVSSYFRAKAHRPPGSRGSDSKKSPKKSKEREREKEIIEVTDSNAASTNPFIADFKREKVESMDSNARILASRNPVVARRDDVVDKENDDDPPGSSSSSLLYAPKTSPTEPEEDGDSRGQRRGHGAKYDRFDTGFWEDESTCGPDSSNNNVHVKVALRNDGKKRG